MPDTIPTGAVLKCECGVTVADLAAWEGHSGTHEYEPGWSFIDAQTGEPID